MNRTPIAFPSRRAIRSRVASLLAVGLLLTMPAACSDSDKDSNDDTGSSTETSAQTTGATGGSTGTASPDTGQLDVLNDIVDCENDGGTGRASGTLENQGAEPTGYTLEMSFVDDASGDVLGKATTSVDTVEPGAAGDWTVVAPGLGTAEVTCRTAGIKASNGG